MIRLILLFAVLCLVFCSCDQDPSPVEPVTESAQWCQIAEGSYGLGDAVDVLWGFPDGVVLAGNCDGVIARYDGSEWIDPFYDAGMCVTDIWGVASDDFYALTASHLYRHDGSGWAVVRDGGRAIWGDGSGRLFLAADDGICMYDASAWSVIDDTPDRLVNGIWGTSADDVYFAGNDGLLHFDGESVEVIPGSPDVVYNDVWGTSSSDVIMVGEQLKTVHYDGSTVTLMAEGIGTLLSVWGTGPDNWYAAATEFLGYYDGTMWWATYPRPYGTYRSIWGSGPDDIYIGGFHDEVIHFDGEHTELLRGIRADQVHALWVDPDSGDLVTSEGRRLFRFDGTAWKELPANLRSSVSFLWGGSIDRLYAGGCGGITRLDGSGWERVAPLPFYPTAVWYHDESCTYLAGPDLIRFDGKDWTVVVDNVDRIESIHGTSPSNVYAVGGNENGGFVFRCDGSAWELIKSGFQGAFKDVWVVSETEVYLVGYFDGVLRFDGRAWKSEPVPAGTRMFRTLWGDSRNNIYCGGLDWLMHFNGYAWSPVLYRGGEIFTHLAGRPSGEVYTVINHGDVLLKPDP